MTPPIDGQSDACNCMLSYFQDPKHCNSQSPPPPKKKKENKQAKTNEPQKQTKTNKAKQKMQN